MGSWRTRRLNLFRDLQAMLRFETLSEIVLPFVPMGTMLSALSGGYRFTPPHATCPAGALPQWNSLWSIHMRCMITASLRATAVQTSHPEKALGQTRHLPQRKLEQPFQRQAKLDRPVREPQRSTGPTVRRRKPFHLRIKPYIQRASPLQCGVIFRPIGRAILR